MAEPWPPRAASGDGSVPPRRWESTLEPADRASGGQPGPGWADLLRSESLRPEDWAGLLSGSSAELTLPAGPVRPVSTAGPRTPANEGRLPASDRLPAVDRLPASDRPRGARVAFGTPELLTAWFEPRPGGMVVWLRGELDTAVETPARLLLWTCLDAAASGLVVEVSGLFVDVRGFTVLHSLWRAGRERGVGVALAGASVLLGRMADLLVARTVPRCASVAEAWGTAARRG